MLQSCSIEHAVDEVLVRLPQHIHLGMPWAWANPTVSSMPCTGALPSCRSAS